MMILSILVGVLGLAVIVVGVLGLTEKLPGNGIIGLRIPEVRKNQQNWNLAHKIAAPTWIGAGVALVVAAVVMQRVSGWLWLIVGLLIIGAIALIGQGAALAGHAMARIDSRKQKQAEAENFPQTVEGGAGASGVAAGGVGVGGAGGAAGSEPCGDHCGSANGVARGAVSGEACASGQACGNCSLNGACEGGGDAFNATHQAAQASQGVSASAGQAAQAAPSKPSPKLDLEAARRAVEGR